MPDGVTFDLDTRKFERMAKELSRITGKSFKQIINAEAGAILNIAIRRTKAAKARNIVDSVRQWAQAKQFTDGGGMVTVNSGAIGPKGRVWFRPGVGRKWYLPEEWRLPDPLWQDYLTSDQAKDAFIDRLVLKRKKARGLGKQSWKILSEALGNPVKAPAYVGKALARRRDGSQFKPVINVEFHETGDIGYTLHLNNHSPSADNRNAKGRAALAGAVRGRVKFFEKNLAVGVFDSFEAITKAYPGIDVTRS